MKPFFGFRKKIADYHSDRWKSLRSAVKAVSKDPNEESIHEARVAIKKINSFFHLLGYCDPDFDAGRTLKPLNKLFKQMGKVRDHDSLLQLCSRFHIDLLAFPGDHRREKKAYKKLHRHCDNCRDEFRQMKKSGTRQLKHVSIDKWKEYIKGESKNIFRVASSGVTQEACHPMRKSIKHLAYNAGIRDTNGLIKKTAIDQLDQMQDRIGEWHDIAKFRSRIEIIQYGLTHKKEFAAIARAEKKLFGEIVSMGHAFSRVKP